MSIDVFEYKVNLVEELGRGAFGTVYKGVKKSNGGLVAVKKVPKSNGRMASTESIRFHTIKKEIHHKQIVKVIDIKSKDEDMWIFMEYCDMGDLNRFFRTKEQIANDLGSKIKLMKQIINGIVYLHSKDVVHRDIKPGNILLKSNPDGDILVKLGDFGLSRFLDPDGSTSAMSSNVGTLAFKAPEFWQPQEGDKISYHRNVDVYAAGLTFAAMLQARIGRGLVPNIEGSSPQGMRSGTLHREDFHDIEKNMPIGLAMLNRRVNGQPDIVVISPKSEDSENLRKSKESIQEMTRAEADKRPVALAVQTHLQNLLPMRLAAPNVTFNVTNTGLFKPDSLTMTFVNDNLVVRGEDSKTEMKKLYIYTQLGTFLRDFPSGCNHSLSRGSLMVAIKGAFAFLMEACPKCKDLKFYDLFFKEVRFSSSHPNPRGICPTKGYTSVVKDSQDGTEVKFYGLEIAFSSAQLEQLNLCAIYSMCFSGRFNMFFAITSCSHQQAIDYHKFDLVGIKWSTGQHWRVCSSHITFKGTPIPLDPRSVCSTPQGWVLLANGLCNDLLILDPRDGSVIERLLDPRLKNISEVVCSNSAQNTLVVAVRHGHPKAVEISCLRLKCCPSEFDINIEDISSNDTHR